MELERVLASGKAMSLLKKDELLALAHKRAVPGVKPAMKKGEVLTLLASHLPAAVSQDSQMGAMDVDDVAAPCDGGSDCDEDMDVDKELDD